MSRKGVGRGAVALLAAIGCLPACAKKKPEGFVVAIQPVDADSALVVWRANLSDRSLGWVGRIDASGKIQWVQALPEPPLSVGPRNGILVDGELVAVRYARNARRGGLNQALAAFNLADGKPRWDTELTTFVGSAGATPSLELYVLGAAGGGRFHELASDGKEVAFYSVEEASGKLIARRRGPGPDQAPIVLGERLVTHETDATQFLDLRGGDEAVTLSTAGGGCVVGDEYLAIETSEPPALVAYKGADPKARRVIAQPFQPLGAPGTYQHLISCGQYGDQLVFTISSGSGEESAVVVTDAVGTVVRTIALGNDMHWDSHPGRAEYPESAPLAGKLPRFVIYPRMLKFGKNDPPHLISLDLEQGRIAWEAAAVMEVTTSIFQAEGRWYVSSGGPGPTVSVFDGATGKLLAAARLYDYDGIGEVLPLHVVAGKLWVTSGHWSPLGQPSVAVLDAATLKPQFARRVEVTDVTAEQQKKLGLP